MPSGASQNARFKALETVSITIAWLTEKEKEIEEAFNPRGVTRESFNRIFQGRSNANKINRNRAESGEEFLQRIKNFVVEQQSLKNAKNRLI